MGMGHVGMGHLWLNGWGIYHLMGGAFKWVEQSWQVAVSFGNMLKKCSFQVIAN